MRPPVTVAGKNDRAGKGFACLQHPDGVGAAILAVAVRQEGDIVYLRSNAEGERGFYQLRIIHRES